MNYKSYIDKVKTSFMLCYIFLFLIDSFFYNEFWVALIIPILVVIFIISFLSVKGFNKYLSLIMMIIGIYLLISNDAGLQEWTDALTKNIGITTFLLSVPLLSIIFYFGDFSSHITHFGRKYVNTSFRFYIFTFIMANFLGIIMNLGSLPLIDKFLEDIYKHHSENLYYTALTRGFVLAQLWAPNFVATAVALQYSKLQWYMYAPLGFLLSIVGILTSIITARKTTKRIENKSLEKQLIDNKGEDDIRLNGIMRIISTTIVLILFIICFQFFSGKSILVVVPFVSIVFPVFLAVLLGKLCIFKSEFKKYLNTILPNKNKEVVLFTSIGFLGHALSLSGVDKYIVLIIDSMGIKSPLILILVIVNIIFLFSIMGLHPILSISAISLPYYAGAIPISQLQFAAAISIGYFSYTICSPFSAMILSLTSLKNKSPLDVGFKINFVFCIILIFIFSIIVSMIPQNI